MGVTALLAVHALVAAGFTWPGAPAVDAADLESLDRGQRLRAVERLGARADVDVRASLAPLLTDSDITVRATTARILSRLGAPEATLAALRWLTAPSPVDRPVGLLVFRDATTLPAAVRAAVDRCLRDAEVTIRLLALDVLSRHGAGPSFSAVAGALDDEQREVRLRAIRLLQDAGDRRAVTLLLGRLGDSDRQVNLEAIAALGALGDTGTLPALLRIVQTGPDDVRLAAIDALGQLGAPAAVAALAPLARKRPSDEPGRHALLALGQIASGPALDVLIDRLREPPVSQEVKEALRRAGAAAVPPLVAQLDRAGHGASTATVTAAVMILGAIGDRRATAALAGLVDRKHPAAFEALPVLAMLKDPAALVTLVRATRDEDPDLRRLAFEALLAIGDPGGAAALDAGLVDADPGARRAALRLVARLGTRSAAADVLASVSAEDAGVRRDALAALTALGVVPPGTLAALLVAAQRLDRSDAGGGDPPGEAAALGDALEAASTEADRATLAKAAFHALAAARQPLLRGLVAALTRGPPPAPDSISPASLLALVQGGDGAGGALAEVAADALVAAGLSARDEAALIAAFDGAEPAVRARLLPALAEIGTAATLAHLRAVLEDGNETDEVRAAAAWAAAGVGDGGVRAALLHQATTPGPDPVQANARAALNCRPGKPRQWTALRLSQPAEVGPFARRWVVLRTQGGATVWAMTGASGELRVWNLGPSPVTVSAAEPNWSLAGALSSSAGAP